MEERASGTRSYTGREMPQERAELRSQGCVWVREKIRPTLSPAGMSRWEGHAQRSKMKTSLPEVHRTDVFLNYTSPSVYFSSYLFRE